jgi:hypothetical protein
MEEALTRSQFQLRSVRSLSPDDPGLNAWFAAPCEPGSPGSGADHPTAPARGPDTAYERRSMAIASRWPSTRLGADLLGAANDAGERCRESRDRHPPVQGLQSHPSVIDQPPDHQSAVPGSGHPGNDKTRVLLMRNHGLHEHRNLTP